MAEVTFRTYREGDETAINAAFNAVFGLERGIDEWRWKFAAGGEEPCIMLALDASGTVLAQYGALPVRLWAHGTEVWAGQIVDILARPEARRGLAAARVFATTVRGFVSCFCRADRLAVAYGFPGARHMRLVRLGTARLGDDEMPPQPVPFWTRRLGVRDPRWSWHKVVQGLDATAADDLWRRARSRYQVGVVRDGRWSCRRFAGRPGVQYVHLTARRGERVHASAVMRLAPPRALLVDLVWDGESPRSLLALDRAVCEIAGRSGSERLEMWLGGDTAAGEVLSQCGWSPVNHPEGLAMAAYSFHPKVRATEFPGRFYLTMADADLV